jgi:hypothetical protein
VSAIATGAADGVDHRRERRALRAVEDGRSPGEVVDFGLDHPVEAKQAVANAHGAVWASHSGNSESDGAGGGSVGRLDLFEDRVDMALVRH